MNFINEEILQNIFLTLTKSWPFYLNISMVLG